jgi:hypothetical protein
MHQVECQLKPTIGLVYFRSHETKPFVSPNDPSNNSAIKETPNKISPYTPSNYSRDEISKEKCKFIVMFVLEHHNFIIIKVSSFNEDSTGMLKKDIIGSDCEKLDQRQSLHAL